MSNSNFCIPRGYAWHAVDVGIVELRVERTYLRQEHERLPFCGYAKIVASVPPVCRVLEVGGVQLLSRGGIIRDDDCPMVLAVWTPV